MLKTIFDPERVFYTTLKKAIPYLFLAPPNLRNKIAEQMNGLYHDYRGGPGNYESFQSQNENIKEIMAEAEKSLDPLIYSKILAFDHLSKSFDERISELNERLVKLESGRRPSILRPQALGTMQIEDYLKGLVESIDHEFTAREVDDLLQSRGLAPLSNSSRQYYFKKLAAKGVIERTGAKSGKCSVWRSSKSKEAGEMPPKPTQPPIEMGKRIPAPPKKPEARVELKKLREISSLEIDGFEYNPSLEKKIGNLSYAELPDGRIFLKYYRTKFYTTREKLNTLPSPLKLGYLSNLGINKHAVTAINKYLLLKSLEKNLKLSDLRIPGFKYDRALDKKIGNFSYAELPDNRIVLRYHGEAFFTTKEKLDSLPKPIPPGYLHSLGFRPTLITAIYDYLSLKNSDKNVPTAQEKTPDMLEKQDLLIPNFEFDPSLLKTYKNLTYAELPDGRIALRYSSSGTRCSTTKEKLASLPSPLPLGYLRNLGLREQDRYMIRTYLDAKRTVGWEKTKKTL